MFDYEEMISDYRNEADRDFVGLWEIASDFQERFGSQNQHEIREHSLEVVRGLMARGVYPGDYDYATQLLFWPGSADELSKRIEAEWIALGKTPNLEHPVCWFGLRPEAE